MYEDINEDHLKAISQNKDNKLKAATECDITMLQLFYTKKNLYYHIKEKMKLYELSLWLKSMKLYLHKKTEYSNEVYNQKRKILYVDFGFGIGNELAYEHPCVLIETKYDNIFVVPCSTGQLNKAKNKDGSINEGYLVTDNTNGFSRETALILHGARWISRRRVVRDTGIKVPADFFEEIKRELLKLSLKSEFHYIQALEAKNDKQLKKYELLVSENKEIARKFDDIERERNELLEVIDKLES